MKNEMSSTLHELTDAEMESAAGGMSCKDAIAVASVLRVIAVVQDIAGDVLGSAGTSAIATGVLIGGCGIPK